MNLPYNIKSYTHSGVICCDYCGSAVEVILFEHKESQDWNAYVCTECWEVLKDKEEA